MSIRFHDECQTAQPDDCLWIYLGHFDSNCYYPIGKYYGTKNWPEFQLLLPGNKLWFVLETALPGEDLDPTTMYGFRCTVDGFCTPGATGGGKILPNGILEQQFAWLISSACRLLVQAPSYGKNAKKMQEREEIMHEIIRKHGTLLKKGLHIDHLPTIKDAMTKKFPSIVSTQERTFLDEFIQASTESSAGRLARALSFDQPFVDLSLSTIEIEAAEISVGKSVGLVLVQKDQFNKDAKCTNLAIEISITSADDVVTHDLAFEQDLQNQNSPQPTSSNTSLNTDDQQNWRLGQVIGNDGFQTLKQLQMVCLFLLRGVTKL
uniref:Uncharacterized protein n=1 Tax=Panagrolaimus superbus TaxID=310955 RepID=A0A914XYK6_9BILA